MSLKVLDAARAVAAAGEKSFDSKRRKSFDSAAAKRVSKSAATVPQPSRKSRRLRGDVAPEEGEGDAEGREQSPEFEEPRLLTCDEWLERNGIEPGPLMDGHFSGWVSDKAREELGIAASAAEAWEQNGGGKFDRKVPKGETAKEFARKMMRKNPNAYFYRHNMPGEDTWVGDWGEDEIQYFVQVAKKYGCGDKWGLFASHIPHRVGYQCSSAYRHIVIPRGLLRDNNFKLTMSGDAIWCGGRGGRGGREE